MVRWHNLILKVPVEYSNLLGACGTFQGYYLRYLKGVYMISFIVAAAQAMDGPLIKIGCERLADVMEKIEKTIEHG